MLRKHTNNNNYSSKHSVVLAQLNSSPVANTRASNIQEPRCATTVALVDYLRLDPRRDHRHCVVRENRNLVRTTAVGGGAPARGVVPVAPQRGRLALLADLTHLPLLALVVHLLVLLQYDEPPANKPES